MAIGSERLNGFFNFGKVIIVKHDIVSCSDNFVGKFGIDSSSQ